MENQKMQMNKRKFRIGDLAKKLQVKKFVIRFWEKEFQLQSDRSQGGQRFYTQDDLTTFSTIKELLYEKKYTIPGAKKELDIILSEKISTTETLFAPVINSIQPAQKEPQEEILYKEIVKEITKLSPQIIKKVSELKQKLEKLKKQLD